MSASGHSHGLPMLSSADWLTRPQTQAVFKAIADGGYEARAVGGAVRNTLMGHPALDVDLATNAPPEMVAALAEAAGLKSVATGLAHGTVTVISDHIPFEVTTLREDVETYGRHAKVAFTADWAADARRRDFTMNALYCAADGTLHDPLGGYPDLVARRVRFIGDASARIAEDYLRILRFFRFNAEYASLPYDDTGLGACVQARGGLSRLSAERVRTELMKLLVAPGAIDAVETMLNYGLLVEILGAVPLLTRFKRVPDIEARLGEAPDAVRRLGALTILKPEDAARLTAHLRLSNEDRARLTAMAVFEPISVSLDDDIAARRTLYRLGVSRWHDGVFAAGAAANKRHHDFRKLYDLPARWPLPVMPVKGAHLLSRGIPAGPEMGETLRRLEQAWIDSDFSLSREDLLERL